MKKNSIARSMAPGSLSPDLLAAVDGGILNFDLGDKRITETVKGQENNSDNTWARDVGTNYAIKYAGNDPAAMETLLNQRDKNVKDSKPDVAPTYSVP